MKKLLILAVTLCCGLGFESVAWAQTAVQTTAGSKVRVQLIDGSQILGVTPSESIKVKLEFSELTIPLEKIRRIELKPKSSIARIELLNDDILSGQLVSDSIMLQALFGGVDLKWEHLKSIDRLPPTTSGSMPIRKGLVAYYSFDHGQEGIGADDAAEKFRAEVNGAKWIEGGKLGGAAEFDGKSSLTVAHHDALNFTKGLTLSAWIKPDDTDRYGYAMIAGKTTGSSWSGGFGLAKMSGDAENVHFFVNYYSSMVVKAPVQAGQWTHVAGTFDGGTLKIFVNGKEAEVLNIKASDGTSSVDVATVNVPLMFGSDQSGYFWKGKLDETALFDRALSDEEVLRLYEAGGTQFSAAK